MRKSRGANVRVMRRAVRMLRIDAEIPEAGAPTPRTCDDPAAPLIGIVHLITD